MMSPMSRPSTATAKACAIHPPVRPFADPVTGVTIHQLTEGPEPSGPLYFTRPSWTADGRHMVLVRQRERSANFYVSTEGGTLRQITHLPAPPAEPAYTPHMH